MIARRLPSILPPLSPEEAIEVTRIQSVAGMREGAGLVTARPFRAPAPHDLGRRARRRRQPAAARRGDARAPRRPLPRRALGVRAPEPRGAATAARGRPGDDRPRPAGHGLPDELHARRRLEPVPVRLRRAALHVRGAVDIVRHRRRLSGPLLDRIDILMRVERPASEALRRQIAPASALGPRTRHRRPRAPAAPARRPARDLQRPADVEADPRLGRVQPEASAAAQRALRPPHALGPRAHAHPARGPHRRRPRRL